MIQLLVGMNPFEALALLKMVDSYHIVWWHRAPLLRRGFLLVCSWSGRMGGPVEPSWVWCFNDSKEVMRVIVCLKQCFDIASCFIYGLLANYLIFSAKN